MIEKLASTQGTAFGFKVVGELTTGDIANLSEQILAFISQQKRPIGLLADLSAMHGATWSARWAEMRFLQKHTDHIARFAVISNDQWQELSEMVLVATASLQAETLYFHASEILHAWHWARMNPLAEHLPPRVISSGKGLFHDYTPEYTGL